MPAPINNKPEIEPWIRPKETTAALNWAPLAILDLSTFDEPGGKEALAEQLKDAVKNWGFWIVTGVGISQELIDRQLAIGNAFFKLPVEDKRKIACDFGVGGNFGYREPTRSERAGSNIKENFELLNLPKSTPEYASVIQHPFLNAFQDEIGPFHRLLWGVAKKVYILMAVMLELPETYFLDRHAYDEPSEDLMRWLLYHPRSAEDDAKVDDQWVSGHTDFGSLSLLFSQNIAGLQVRTPDNEWKWVKPVEGGITCNAADMLSFLTKGYIKSTIHRVVRPPADQANIERLTLGYFARPGNDVLMVPAPSPVLRREGFLTEEEEELAAEDPVRAYEYIRARVKYVNDRKVTFYADRNEETTFRVGNLAVKDFYS